MLGDISHFASMVSKYCAEFPEPKDVREEGF